MRTIRLGFSLSIVYNVVGAALAIGGHIHPLFAAVAMPVSSLTVLTVAWRARTFPAPASRGESAAVPAADTLALARAAISPGREPLPCR